MLTEVLTRFPKWPFKSSDLQAIPQTACDTPCPPACLNLGEYDSGGMSCGLVDKFHYFLHRCIRLHWNQSATARFDFHFALGQ